MRIDVRNQGLKPTAALRNYVDPSLYAAIDRAAERLAGAVAIGLARREMNTACL